MVEAAQASKPPAQATKPAHRPPAVHHPVLDVHSVKQGSMRLQVFIYSITLLVLMGLYFCVGAVINFQQVDSDARDIITNMRQMILTRETQHAVHVQTCQPRTVVVSRTDQSTNDTATVSAIPTVVLKLRERLPDPRLLPLTDVVQPMVMMRDRRSPETGQLIPAQWTYYQASMEGTHFPSFGWNRTIAVSISYSISPDKVLQSVQIFNTYPKDLRPTLVYKQTTNDQEQQLWSIDAVFTLEVPAYKIVGPDLKGNVSVRRLNQTLIETRFASVDVPATFVETNVASERYRNGQPEFKTVLQPLNESDPESPRVQQSCDVLFNKRADCRDTISVPQLFSINGTQYVEIYNGSLSGLRTAIATDLVAAIEVTIRDFSQPRPYVPLMVGFGQPFFVGFAFLSAAIIFLVSWWGLRYSLVTKNVRENEGKPPMFYQGMLRYRGW